MEERGVGGSAGDAAGDIKDAVEMSREWAAMLVSLPATSGGVARTRDE